MTYDHWKTTEPDHGCSGYGLSETEQAAGKMLNAMQAEIDALQEEVAALRRDIAMQPSSHTLLYSIREALGFNKYYPLSHLDDDARRLMRQHAEMLAALRAVDDHPIPLAARTALRAVIAKVEARL